MHEIRTVFGNSISGIDITLSILCEIASVLCMRLALYLADSTLRDCARIFPIFSDFRRDLQDDEIGEHKIRVNVRVWVQPQPS